MATQDPDLFPKIKDSDDALKSSESAFTDQSEDRPESVLEQSSVIPPSFSDLVRGGIYNELTQDADNELPFWAANQEYLNKLGSEGNHLSPDEYKESPDYIPGMEKNFPYGISDAEAKQLSVNNTIDQEINNQSAQASTLQRFTPTAVAGATAFFANYLNDMGIGVFSSIGKAAATAIGKDTLQQSIAGAAVKGGIEFGGTVAPVAAVHANEEDNYSYIDALQSIGENTALGAGFEAGIQGVAEGLKGIAKYKASAPESPLTPEAPTSQVDNVLASKNMDDLKSALESNVSDLKSQNESLKDSTQALPEEPEFQNNKDELPYVSDAMKALTDTDNAKPLHMDALDKLSSGSKADELQLADDYKQRFQKTIDQFQKRIDDGDSNSDELQQKVSTLQDQIQKIDQRTQFLSNKDEGATSNPVSRYLDKNDDYENLKNQIEASNATETQKNLKTRLTNNVKMRLNQKILDSVNLMQKSQTEGLHFVQPYTDIAAYQKAYLDTVRGNPIEVRGIIKNGLHDSNLIDKLDTTSELNNFVKKDPGNASDVLNNFNNATPEEPTKFTEEKTSEVSPDEEAENPEKAPDEESEGSTLMQFVKDIQACLTGGV